MDIDPQAKNEVIRYLYQQKYNLRQIKEEKEKSRQTMISHELMGIDQKKKGKAVQNVFLQQKISVEESHINQKNYNTSVINSLLKEKKQPFEFDINQKIQEEIKERTKRLKYKNYMHDWRRDSVLNNLESNNGNTNRYINNNSNPNNISNSQCDNKNNNTLMDTLLAIQRNEMHFKQKQQQLKKLSNIVPEQQQKQQQEESEEKFSTNSETGVGMNSAILKKKDKENLLHSYEQLYEVERKRKLSNQNLHVRRMRRLSTFQQPNQSQQQQNRRRTQSKNYAPSQDANIPSTANNNVEPNSLNQAKQDQQLKQQLLNFSSDGNALQQQSPPQPQQHLRKGTFTSQRDGPAGTKAALIRINNKQRAVSLHSRPQQQQQQKQQQQQQQEHVQSSFNNTHNNTFFSIGCQGIKLSTEQITGYDFKHFQNKIDHAHINSNINKNKSQLENYNNNTDNTATLQIQSLSNKARSSSSPVKIRTATVKEAFDNLQNGMKNAVVASKTLQKFKFIQNLNHSRNTALNNSVANCNQNSIKNENQFPLLQVNNNILNVVATGWKYSSIQQQSHQQSSNSDENEQNENKGLKLKLKQMENTSKRISAPKKKINKIKQSNQVSISENQSRNLLLQQENQVLSAIKENIELQQDRDSIEFKDQIIKTNHKEVENNINGKENQYEEIDKDEPAYKLLTHPIFAKKKNKNKQKENQEILKDSQYVQV